MTSSLADKRRDFMVSIRKDAIQAMMEERRRKLMGMGPKVTAPQYNLILSKSDVTL